MGLHIPLRDTVNQTSYVNSVNVGGHVVILFEKRANNVRAYEVQYVHTTCIGNSAK